MGGGLIHDVILTPLKIIEVSGGNVMHAMKYGDPGFSDYGEAYFSLAEQNVIKAWKRHHKMILNIVVPVGQMRFVLFDDRDNSPTWNKYQIVELSKKNYYRLTVPPMIWIGIQGMSENVSVLLNIASIQHDPEEIDRKKINEIDFEWSDE
jgi:dTDP-4-dehydrorhamnose 3,5-epimerase